MHCTGWEKVSFRFQHIKLVESAIEAEVKPSRGRHGVTRMYPRNSAPVEGKPSPPSPPHFSGGRRSAHRLSITLDGLHIAVVADCSRTEAKGVHEGIANCSPKRASRSDEPAFVEGSSAEIDDDLRVAKSVLEDVSTPIALGLTTPACESGEHTETLKGVAEVVVEAETAAAARAKGKVRGAQRYSGSPTQPPSGNTDAPPRGLNVVVDARLLPACASLSIGVFTLRCSDDRARNGDGMPATAADGVMSGRLGRLEIVGRGKGGEAPDFPATISFTSTDVEEEEAQGSSGNNALDVTWSTLASTDEDEEDGTKLKLARAFREMLWTGSSAQFSDPTGGRALVRLGELSVQCRPSEGAVEAVAGAAKHVVEESATSLSSVVVSSLTAVPTIVFTPKEVPKHKVPIEQPPNGLLPQQQSLPPLPSGPSPSSLLPGCVRTLLGTLRSFRQWLMSRERLPLMWPSPQLGASSDTVDFHVLEVKVEASAVTGTVDARLAGWLNLRGVHEAEALTAMVQRKTNLILAGGTPQARTDGTRKIVSIDTVRVAVEEFLENPPTIACKATSEEKLAGVGGKRRPGHPGRFDFEADNVSVQQEQTEHRGKSRIPAPCDKLLRSLAGSRSDSVAVVQDTSMLFKEGSASVLSQKSFTLVLDLPARLMQCSRASVSLADRLPPPFAASATAASRTRASAIFTGCPLPPQGGARDGDNSNSNSNNRDDNTAAIGVVETSTEGRSERVPLGVAEGRANDDGDAATWSGLKLEFRGVCMDKVVEKDSLGRTARVTIAISCKEALTALAVTKDFPALLLFLHPSRKKVSGTESIGEEYCERIANLVGLSFAQVRVGNVLPVLGPAPDAKTTGDGTQAQPGVRNGATGDTDEVNDDGSDQPTAAVTRGGDGHVATAASAAPVGGGGAVPRSPPPPAARGAVKAEHIIIDRTDMAWSGSVHCMLLRLSQRLVSTIDHLVGFPPPPLPVEFTRRVLLRGAYLRCALSEVTEGRPLRSPLPSQRPLARTSRSSSSSFSSTSSLDDLSFRQPAMEGGPRSPDNDHGGGKEGAPCFPPSSAPLHAPWCHHRADVRLANFNMSMKKEKRHGKHRDSNTDSGHDRNPLAKTAFPSSRGREEIQGEGRRDNGRSSTPQDEKLAPDHDAEMTMDADLLEILVPSPRPLQADLKQQPGLHFASRGAWQEGVGDDGSCDPTAASARTNPHKDKTDMAGFPKGDDERLSTAAAVGVSATTASSEGEAIPARREHQQRTWCGLMESATRGGDSGSTKPLVVESSQAQGSVGEEATRGERGEATESKGDGVGSDNEGTGDGHPGNGDDSLARMTRIVAISSFRFRRSLDWSLPRQEQHEKLASAATGGVASATLSSGSGEPGAGPKGEAGGVRRGHSNDSDNGCSGTARRRENRGTENTSSLDVKARRGSAGRRGHGNGDGGVGGELSQPRLWSRTGIEVRAGHIAVSLPPRFQLGDLQVAAILQWKGIQEALGETSPSSPSDSCATSVLLGGFTLHLEREPPPERTPPPNCPAPAPPSSSPPSPLPRSILQRQGAVKFGSIASTSEGRHSGSGFFSALNLSRGSGSIGGEGGNSINSSSMPWPQHPRMMVKGLRQSGASLSSLLGFGSSGSGSDLSDHGGRDNARSTSRRSSASPAATGADTPKRRSKRITQVPAGEGGDEAGGFGDGRGFGIDKNRGRNVGDRISETESAREARGDGFGGNEARAKPLAVLTLGEISFEPTLLAAVRELDEHPGPVTYGQTMGGWGKLSLSSTAVYLDGLPVPYVTADNVVVDGLFARGVAATDDGGCDQRCLGSIESVYSSSPSDVRLASSATLEDGKDQETDEDQGGWVDGEKEEGCRKGAADRTPPTTPTVAPAPHVEFWDRLRCILHGKLSLDVDKVEVTALLDRSPAALGASLRLLVSKAKVAYTCGHLDLNLQHTLLSTPARPPAEVLRMEDVVWAGCGPAAKISLLSFPSSPNCMFFPSPSASGPPVDPRRRGSSSPHASPCQSPVSRGQDTRVRPDSRRYQHPNNTPACPLSGLDRERGSGGCGGNVYGRSTSAAAALGSAAAVAADTFSSEEPSLHPQRQQAGRGSFPPLSPSNSMGVAPFDSGLPSRNVGGGMGMDCPAFMAKRGAGDVLDGGNGGTTIGLGDSSGTFGARHSVAFVAEIMLKLDIAWACAGHAGPNGHHLEILSTAGTVGQGREDVRGAVDGSAATIATATATATATSGISSGGGAGFSSPSIPASRPANPAPEGNRSETNNSTAATSTKGHSDLWAPYRATGLKLKISAEISPDKIGSGGGGGGGGDRQSPQGQGGACVSPATSPVPVRRTISSSGDGSLGVSPVHGGTLKSVPRNNGSSSGDGHASRPNSFPRSKPMGEEDKEEDDDAGGSDTCSGLRAHRHQRADSNGPLRPPRWMRAKAPEAAGHGNVSGSGFLSDMMRWRCRTVSDMLEEQLPLEQAGARRRDKLSISREVFDGGGGEVEALAGRSSTIGSRSNEEGGGSGGGGGEGEGEGRRQNISRRQPFPSLTITADDDNETAGGLPGFVELDSTSAAGGRFSGPASCPSRPSGCRGEARDSFNAESAQGFWIALRLDLIQWFMPLPIADTATAATDDFETQMSYATPLGENSRHGATAAAASAATRSTPQTAQRTTPDVSEPTEDSEEASILRLVESVSVRASVRGLALATWRGADNRDGFALDIDSFHLAVSAHAVPPAE
ncbi:unnamed protein product [Ectocarpus sp. CCAP 1310/34]|nr:unnamed protein product [Ectocarpus sp. CCAP 1310/34]